MEKLNIEFGNIEEAGKDTRGWIVGSFKDGLKYSDKVEIKSRFYKKGEIKESNLVDDTTTMNIFCYGKLKVVFDGDKEVNIENKGDYFVYSPGVKHKAYFLEDTFVIAVRWRNK